MGGVISSVVESSGALAEKLSNEYGAKSDIVEFVREFELPHDKLIVAMVLKPKPAGSRDIRDRRYWVVFDNPAHGRPLGYGREVRFANYFNDMEKLDVGSAQAESTEHGMGLFVGTRTVRFFVVRRRDIFAARVVR
jgi:hypothetical protein